MLVVVFVVLFAVGILLFLLASVYFGFRGMAWLMAEVSGWHRLQTQFGCVVDDGVWTWRGQTIQVGAVRFRSCVSVAMQSDALLLRVMSIFRLKTLRIPWNRMEAFQATTVYGLPAMQFTAGGVNLAVPTALYASIYPHLKPKQP